MPIAPRDRATAQHEAAHAVVGVYLGLPLRRVRVEPPTPALTGSGSAHFDCERKNSPNWEGYARRLHLGIMYAAGAAGDALHGRDTPYHWRVDFRLIREVGFSKAERRVLLDIARQYLAGPCKREWSAVTEALLERDLTGPEIKALVLHGTPLEVDT
jgi:hypothetical protein